MQQWVNKLSKQNAASGMNSEQSEEMGEPAVGVEEAASALWAALESSGEVRIVRIHLGFNELANYGWTGGTTEGASKKEIGDIGQKTMAGLAKTIASFGIKEQFTMRASTFALQEFRAPRMNHKHALSIVDLGIMRDDYSGLRAVIEVKTFYRSATLGYYSVANQIETLAIIKRSGWADSAWIAVVGIGKGPRLQPSVISLCYLKEVGLIHTTIDM